MTSPSDLDQARYAAMRWNTPLSVDHAALLVDGLALGPAVDVLDLGCGWGELLMRAIEAGGSGATGVGIDNDEQVLARARALAAARGLHRQVDFVHAESATWEKQADRVLCISASHAWAGVEQALHALARVVRPGGRVLFGEGCWERPPTAAAAELFGEDVIALTDIVRLARATNWQVLHLSTADQREWDDFEATWRRGRQQWLLITHTTTGAPTSRTPSTRNSRSTSRYTAAYSASATSSSAGKPGSTDVPGVLTARQKDQMPSELGRCVLRRTTSTSSRGHLTGASIS